MKPERLLVAKLDDIEDRCNVFDITSEYELCEMGRLCYHVICDDLLADVVNEVRWPPVTFRVFDPSPHESEPVIEISERPLSGPPGTELVVEIGLGKFENRRLLRFGGEDFTVNHALQLLANGLGGKHHRGPKKAILQKLDAYSTADFSTEFPGGGGGLVFPSVLAHQVLDIARVTLAATHRLRTVLRLRP